MDFHAAANIFPLDEEHINELAEDIKTQGQLVPIELLDGQVLDGRRRFLACQFAGIEPDMVEVDPPDPVAYVLSLNLHRRHLSVSQLGMVGAAAIELYEKAAKGRMLKGKKTDPVKNSPQGSTGKSRDQAGAAVGVSGNTIDKARVVKQEGIPELATAVETGALSLNRAHRVAKLPADQQPDAMKEALKPRSTSPRNVARRPATEPKEDGAKDLPEGVSRGVGVRKGHEAVDCLRRIPKNDPLRKRGFQIVTDWIRQNR